MSNGKIEFKTVKDVVDFALKQNITEKQKYQLGEIGNSHIKHFNPKEDVAFIFSIDEVHYQANERYLPKDTEVEYEECVLLDGEAYDILHTIWEDGEAPGQDGIWTQVGYSIRDLEFDKERMERIIDFISGEYFENGDIETLWAVIKMKTAKSGWQDKIDIIKEFYEERKEKYLTTT